MGRCGALLAPLQDCGPLVPADPGGAGLPLGATVTVTGNVAERGRIEAIREALAARSATGGCSSTSRRSPRGSAR